MLKTGLTGVLADGGRSGGLSSELFESCFPARRNLVCPSFALLAVFGLGGLATGAGKMRRDRVVREEGRETQIDPG